MIDIVQLVEMSTRSLLLIALASAIVFGYGYCLDLLQAL